MERNLVAYITSPGVLRRREYVFRIFNCYVPFVYTLLGSERIIHKIHCCKEWSHTWYIK